MAGCRAAAAGRTLRAARGSGPDARSSPRSPRHQASAPEFLSDLGWSIDPGNLRVRRARPCPRGPGVEERVSSVLEELLDAGFWLCLRELGV